MEMNFQKKKLWFYAFTMVEHTSALCCMDYFNSNQEHAVMGSNAANKLNKCCQHKKGSRISSYD